MLKLTLRPDPQRFPAGTKVQVFEERLRNPESRLTGKPVGALVTEATVASDGTLKVEVLAGVPYVGWSSVNGGDSYVRFGGMIPPATVGEERVRAEAGEAGLEEIAAFAKALVLANSLPSSKLLQGMASASVMTTPPVFGARVTGLTTATEAANTTIPGSKRVAPLYDTPRSDPIYRIAGAYGRLNGSESIDMGAIQAHKKNGAIGPTGMVGTYAFEFVGQKFEWWGRDTTATSHFTMWVSKNGGPFRPHVNPDVTQELPIVGDGLYFLQPVDMGSRATWRIIIEGEAFTFGGIRYNSATDTLRAPSWSSGRMLVFSDSYGVGGGGYRSASDYPMKLGRSLGLEVHLTGYGGTGISATSGEPENVYNYAGRIKAEVEPYFSASDQPVLIVIQGSINDDLYGYAGTPQLEQDGETLLRELQTLYPDALIVMTHPMHPYRGSQSQNEGDATVGKQIDALAAAFGLPTPYDAVSTIPLTGTGTITAPKHDGNADEYSAADQEHPTPAGSSALAHGIAEYVMGTPLSQRPVTMPMRIAALNALRQAATAAQTTANTALGLAETDKGSLALAGADAARYTLIRDFGQIKLEGLAAGTYVIVPGMPGSAQAANAAGTARGLFSLFKSYFSVAGKTLKIRLRATMLNGTNPEATFTVSLVKAGALAGAGEPGISLGVAAEPAVQAAITPSGEHKKEVASSTDINFPAEETFYLLQLVVSKNMAVGSVADLHLLLEYRNV